MADYTNHSKLLFKNLQEIQDSINNNDIGPYDIVICEDTKQFIMVKDDLSLFPIQSRIYRYLDITSAEEQLNKNQDTYEGQLVSVLSDNGAYEAYIVNRRITGKFYIMPLNAYSGSIDYNGLRNRPIENLDGEIFDPVVLDIQKDGIYRVNGSYKISEALDTVFSSSNNNMFIVSHENGGITTVKRVGSYDITDYIINNGIVTQSVVPTTEWLKSQGYITEGYVDAKLEAMGLITKQEIEEYVENVITNLLDSMIDDRIDNALNQKLQEATEKELVDIFK